MRQFIKRRFLLCLLLVVFCLPVAAYLTPPGVVSAASAANCSGESSSFLDFPTWYKYLPHSFEDGECKLDVEFPQDAGKIILALVEIMLRVGGLVSVAFVIYGGFRYILSNGEPESAKGARVTIINALIGLGIAVSATAIVNLIGNNLIT